MVNKNNPKLRLTLAITLAILSSQSLYAGDVEISLPAAADAFTVDQPAGTELMRVNGDGNVGIGTATPGSALTVLNPGGSVFTSEFQTNEASTSLNSSRGYSVTLVNTDQTTDNFVGLTFNDQAGFALSSAIIGTKFTDHTNNYGELFFSTRGASNTMDTINMVLNEEGNVGIGTTTPSTKLHVAGTITEDSDERLKKDIKPLEGSLDKVLKLQGVSFNWKDSDKYEKGTQLGLIAQEVEKILPEVVKTAENEQGTKSVAYTSLISVLIEGMKEQQKRIESLEAKLK